MVTTNIDCTADPDPIEIKINDVLSQTGFPYLSLDNYSCSICFKTFPWCFYSKFIFTPLINGFLAIRVGIKKFQEYQTIILPTDSAMIHLISILCKNHKFRRCGGRGSTIFFFMLPLLVELTSTPVNPKVSPSYFNF